MTAEESRRKKWTRRSFPILSGWRQARFYLGLITLNRPDRSLVPWSIDQTATRSPLVPSGKPFGIKTQPCGRHTVSSSKTNFFPPFPSFRGISRRSERELDRAAGPNCKWRRSKSAFQNNRCHMSHRSLLTGTERKIYDWKCQQWLVRPTGVAVSWEETEWKTTRKSCPHRWKITVSLKQKLKERTKGTV